MTTSLVSTVIVGIDGMRPGFLASKWAS